MIPKTFGFLLFIVTITLVSAKLSCLNRDGNALPWFTKIKFPGSLTKTNPRYAYLDQKSGFNFEIIQGTLSDGQTQPLTRTIRAINEVPAANKNLLVFNDEIPLKWMNNHNLQASSDAHAKGIIAFDSASQTGVYIMHSIPSFPYLDRNTGIMNTSIPNSGLQYGQHIYCISLDKEILGHLLNNIPLQKPCTYFASGIFANLPKPSTADSAISQFHLLNGENQWFLTKNPKYNGFLFENIVSPYFKVPLAVESWGRPYQNPLCPPHSLFSSVNINVIAFKNGDSWGHTSDHSKWAVTTGKTGPNLACFCDMNRMESQSKRGGSCLCSDNPYIYSALKNLIVQTDYCPTSKKTIHH